MRTVKALDQLTDEEVNASPDPSSHSISALILHIHGNVQERILKGILQQEADRGNPWKPAYMTCAELVHYIQTDMDTVIRAVNSLKPEQWLHTQTVRNRERTHLDMLHQCAAHYSEHMGQILYLTKWLRKEQYKSTSI
ncbi:hypothetical protein GCM10010911_21160 [Paenibacillus nasutitermitis]|uniref:DUF1572 domain-containing protein n=1 Tax=Paenibacillus nasutitermitis TaxID=1652958 RepID=A0A916YVQ2_9BACL|nr:hypothetical protein GCM10010911_21160 [Paenibacillus nasutitermitis]